MDLIKANYDKMLLIVAGLLLAGTALFFVLDTESLAQRFVKPGFTQQGAPFSSDPKILQIKSDRATMDQRGDWKDAEGSLFVSREYLVRDGRLIDILQGDEEIFPGIPNSWIKEHRLDYSDAKLPERDPDGDGFTNMEEFQAQTNPLDPASRPAGWTKLRLSGSKLEKLRFTFSEVTDSEGDTIKEVQINTIGAGDAGAASGRTMFYKIGESVKIAERDATGRRVDTPTPFKVLRAEMRGNAEPMVVLQNTADGKEVILERGKVKDSPYALATLRDSRSGQEFQLRTGEEFELPEGGGRYKLIDVSEEKAQIKNVRTEETSSVPREAPVMSPPPAQ